MVVLRPTRKLRSSLPAAPTSLQSDTALGDWYVNRIVVARQPLLLLVSSASLLPIVLPARDVRSLPSNLAGVVALQLKRLGLESGIVEAERQAMYPVVVAPTVDRSVVGILVDFAKAVSFYEGVLRAERGLNDVADWLAETPCHATRSGDAVMFPNRKAPELLRAKWGARHADAATSGAL